MMQTRVLWASLLCVSLLALHGRADHPLSRDEADVPHNKILAVDVSLSMTESFDRHRHPGQTVPASDPEGIRWDGIQLIIDVARPDDRVALVLFRGEAAVITKAIDDSGFVGLSQVYAKFGKKMGRTILKEVVAEIQQKEEEAVRKGQRISRYELATLEKAQLDMWPGTSVKVALDQVREEGLLKAGGRERQTWMYLFTDGRDEKPFAKPPDQKSSQGRTWSDYDYVDEVNAARDVAGVARIVAPLMKEYRERDVPVFTFGLGSECHLPFLQAIADLSRPPGPRSRGSASYNPKTNGELLQLLQQVEWEVRQDWKVVVEPSLRTRDHEVFRTPVAGIWHDMGVLLARRRMADGQPVGPVLAPLDPDVSGPRVVSARPGMPPAGDLKLAPLTSRSHWYYYLSPKAADAGQAPIDGQLEFGIEHRMPGDKDYATQCIAAVRTRRPLFEYQGPPQGARFSPRDAIPLAVGFTPYTIPGPDGKPIAPFEAKQFEVRATLVQLPGLEGGAVALPRRVPLALFPAEAGHVSRRFGAEVILDEDRASKGQQDLLGQYALDLTIRGVSGPLQGAERRLLRRTIEVTGYPQVRLPGGPVILSNASPDTVRATIPLELTMDTDPRSQATELSARIAKDPGEGPAVAVEQLRILPQPTVIRGRSGEVQVELPASFWSTVRTGRHTGGSFQVRPPWASWKNAVGIELIVEKSDYKVGVPPVTFDLSAGSDSQKRDLTPVLDTRLSTEEKVSLSADGTADGLREKQLTLVSAADSSKTIELEADGIGAEVRLLGGAAKGGHIPLTLKARKQLPPGVYRTTLYLIGPSVVKTAVPLEVVVDQPKVLVERRVKDQVRWEPVTQLDLFALSGTAVERPLRFATALNKEVTSVKATAGMLVRQGGGDSLPAPDFRAEKDKQGQVGLALSVPPSVKEGWYTSQVRFDLAVAGGKDQSLSVPVVMQVAHFGVRPDVRGSLRLKFPDPCGTKAEQSVRLVTASEKNPVRWWIEAVRPPAGAAGQALEPERLGVMFNGQSALGAKRPTDPVTAQDPCLLTVTARTNGLEAGLWRGALRVHSYEQDPAKEGPTADLEVEVLVPGRVMKQVRLAEGPAPVVGRETEVRVSLLCQDCDPGAGKLVLCDAGGAPVGNPVEITHPLLTTPDGSVASLIRHEFAVKFTPRRVGKNFLKVTWPRLCPSRDKASVEEAPLVVSALGAIQVEPALCFKGETAIIRAEVDRDLAPPPGQPILVHVIRRADAASVPDIVELRDDGSGNDAKADDHLYTGQYTFPEVGEYEIRLATAPGTGAYVEPARVHVAFELSAINPDLGTLTVGGGSLRTVLFLPDEMTISRVVEVVNRRAGPCGWKMRLLFPRTTDDATRLFSRDLQAVASETFDPRIHLDASVGRRADEHGLPFEKKHEGTLPGDETLQLDLRSQLPKGDGGEVRLGEHGMVVELTLSWTEDGQTMDRVVQVPVAARVAPWYANSQTWILGATYLVLLAVPLFFAAKAAIPIGRRLAASWRSRQQEAIPPTKSVAGTPSDASRQLQEEIAAESDNRDEEGGPPPSVPSIPLLPD